MAFAVDAPDGHIEVTKEFVDQGFRFNTNKVLTAKHVNPPPKLNLNAIVREIESDDEWAQLLDVHYSDSWYLNPETQIPFLLGKFKDLRKMSDAKIGKRFIDRARSDALTKLQLIGLSEDWAFVGRLSLRRL
jgi:hypothetical protein